MRTRATAAGRGVVMSVITAPRAPVERRGRVDGARRTRHAGENRPIGAQVLINAQLKHSVSRNSACIGCAPQYGSQKSATPVKLALLNNSFEAAWLD